MGISLLDCTLRDGGNGLEVLEKRYGEIARFDEGRIQAILAELRDSKIEIVEIGNIQPTQDDRTRFAQYQTIEELSRIMPQGNAEKQLYAGIYRTPDVELQTIPAWREGLCEVVRVVLRYSELKKSLNFAAGLAEKGYQVSIQPMVTMRYTQEDLRQVIQAANAMGAYAVYFVDSYGCLDFDEIEPVIELYDRELSARTRIGFHAHNNRNFALINSVCFVNKPLRHDRIIDSCVLGMGLSAGNLQTELIADYLNRKFSKQYDLGKILRACEVVNPLYEKGMWGYALEPLVGALHKAAYKYPTEYKNQYGMSYAEIYALLKGMPEEYRYRFTKEYAKNWYDAKVNREAGGERTECR